MHITILSKVFLDVVDSFTDEVIIEKSYFYLEICLSDLFFWLDMVVLRVIFQI